MLKVIRNKLFYLFLLILLVQSCKTIEKPYDIIFDYTQFQKLTFLTGEIEIQNTYNPKYEKPYLDHLLINSPYKRLSDWMNNNIKGFGIENKLVILIKDASIQSSEIESDTKIAGIIKKPNEIKYILNFEVMFIIYNDLNSLIGKTNVKVNRTTTSASSSEISLAERDQILEDLIYNSLTDFTIKSNESVNKYLKKYIL